VTQDNPDTVADEGGLPLLTLPDAGTPIRNISFSVSQGDADGDGYENSLDRCPFHVDTVWNPRIPRTPQQDPPGDSDLLFGQPLGDGIPDTCDPTPFELSSAPSGQPTDHDGDGFANTGDNCPLQYNPDQKDSDVNANGKHVGDGIGDACDTPGIDAGTDCVNPDCSGYPPRPIPGPRSVSGNGPLVVDGAGLICIRTLTLVAGGPNDATVSDCSETLPAASPTPTPSATPSPAATATPTATPGPVGTPTPTPATCILDDNDFDNDGINNRRDKDDDNDGIRDGRDRDDDNDGVIDRIDRDDDNDGIPDRDDRDDGRLFCPHH